MTFKVFYTPEVLEFLESIPRAARTKMYYNIAKVANGNWDIESKSLVIATHGIIKKTQKTPKKRLRKLKESENYITKRIDYDTKR